MTPSHIEVQNGSPLLTVRERIDRLRLLCTSKYAGNSIHVDLMDVFLGYMGIRWAHSCPRYADNPMDIGIYQPVSTSVASSSAPERLAFAMIRENPTAQFLFYGSDYQSVL